VLEGFWLEEGSEFDPNTMSLKRLLSADRCSGAPRWAPIRNEKGRALHMSAVRGFFLGLSSGHWWRPVLYKRSARGFGGKDHTQCVRGFQPQSPDRFSTSVSCVAGRVQTYRIRVCTFSNRTRQRCSCSCVSARVGRLTSPEHLRLLLGCVSALAPFGCVSDRLVLAASLSPSSLVAIGIASRDCPLHASIQQCHLQTCVCIIGELSFGRIYALFTAAQQHPHVFAASASASAAVVCAWLSPRPRRSRAPFCCLDSRRHCCG